MSNGKQDLLHSDSQQMVPESQQDENQQATGYPNAVEYQPVPTGLQPSGCSRTTGYQPYSAPVGQLHYAQPTNQQSEVIVQPGVPQTIMIAVPQQSKPDNCVIPEGNITEARKAYEKVRYLAILFVFFGVILDIIFLIIRAY